MNRPPLSNYAIGHPLVLTVLGVATAATLYRCWIGELTWLAGLVMMLITGASSRAYDRVTSYRRWKREWDAMGDEAPARRRLPKGLQTIGGLLVLALTAALLYTHRRDPLAVLGLGWLSLCVCVGAAVWLFRLWRARRTAHQDEARAHPLVTIAPSTPLLAIPPLSVAYHRLPPHCHRAMQQAPPETHRG